MRRVVTGALEIERAAKRIGSSLEAAPQVFIADPDLLAALDGVDLAEVCITSGIELSAGAAARRRLHAGRRGGRRRGAASRREGKKCARSWRITQDVGSDPAFPELSARDAAAVREFDQRTASAAR